MNGDTALHVMVLGAGSSGLLVAQGLKKAGISCTVFEQDAKIDARPRDWNFGIYWAQSPLTHCLPDELSQLLPTAQVDNHTPTPQDVLPVYSGETGEKLADLPAPLSLRLGRRKFIRLISTDIDIRYGKHLADIQSTGSKVTASFEDGTQHTADLLIGCEGAHSMTREYLLGPEKGALTPSPLLSSVAMAKLPASSVELFQKLTDRSCIWFHPNGYFSWTGVHDSYDKQNVEDWEFMMMHSWKQDEPIHLTGHAILEDMKRRAGEFPEPYRTIYQSIPEGTKCWHNRLSSWVPQPWDNKGGTVTLAGDSAHAMTYHRGQGLNNAVTDAASLHEKIREMPSRTRESLSAAVAEYERELWERGKEAVELSHENSMMIHDWERLRESPLFRAGLSQKVEVPTQEEA